MATKGEIIGFLRSKEGLDIGTIIFIFSILICIFAVAVIGYNMYLSYTVNSSSSKDCEKYIKTQKISDSLTLGLTVVGIGMLIFCFLNSEGKMGELRALFTDEELPIY